MMMKQEISVSEDCMTVTMSHKERRIELPTHQSASTVFCPGVHVMLQDLTPATLAYGDERWTNPSLLNGSTGIIIRREKDLWIVELDKTLMVRFLLNPVKQAGLAPFPLFPSCDIPSRSSQTPHAILREEQSRHTRN
jgi:hypothetical protein